MQVCAVSQEQTKNTMKLLPGLIPMETRRHYGIQLGKLNMYALGDSRQIEAVIRDTLTHYGIENAEVTAVDKGALDCTVRARVTAAIFRSAQSDAYEWEVK